MKTIILLLGWFGILSCVSAESQGSTGTEKFALTRKQRVALVTAARHGDPSAAWRLSQYYGLHENNMEEEVKWLRRGADLKDAKAQYNLAGALLYGIKPRDLVAIEFGLNEAERNAKKAGDANLLYSIDGFRRNVQQAKREEK